MSDWYVGASDSESLAHFGTLGMRWGIRKYQNADGSLTPAGRERYQKIGNKYTKKVSKINDKIAKVAQRKDTKRNALKIDKYDKKVKKYTNKILESKLMSRINDPNAKFRKDGDFRLNHNQSRKYYNKNMTMENLAKHLANAMIEAHSDPLHSLNNMGSDALKTAQQNVLSALEDYNDIFKENPNDSPHVVMDKHPEILWNAMNVFDNYWGRIKEHDNKERGVSSLVKSIK